MDKENEKKEERTYHP